MVIMQERRERRMAIAVEAFWWAVLIIGWGAARWYVPAVRTKWPFWLVLGLIALPIEAALKRDDETHARRQGLVHMAIAPP